MTSHTDKPVYLSVILPCFNEEPIIDHSISCIYKELEGLNLTFEIILVDDKSQDQTAGKILKLLDQYDFLRAEFHLENEGRGKAVKTGLMAARGSIAGFMDIDMEVSPAYLKDVIAALEGGYDVATIKRKYEWNSSVFILYRHVLSQGYRKLLRLVLGMTYEDTESGFKFFRREKVLQLLNLSTFNGWFWDTEIMTLAWQNSFKVIEIEGEFKRRTDKVSSVNSIKDSIGYLRDLVKFKFSKKS